MDVLVGLAFVVAAAVAPGPPMERYVVASVGAAWLVGSFLPVARSLHQGVLLVALGWFASGRPRGPMGWLIAGAAAVVAAQLLPQFAVAAVFAVVAGVAVVRGRIDPVVAWYPSAAAAVVAGCLIAVWTTSHLTLRPLDPGFAVVGYEVVLLGIAALFPVGAGTAVRARDRLADRLLSDQSGGGLDGLIAILRSVLGDPTLRVYLWQDVGSCYVDAAGQIIPQTGPGWLAVDDESRRVAVLVSASAALDDPPTAAAVTSAVLLTVTNIRLQDEQRERLLELEASRARILAAGDRERQRVGSMLRFDVDPSLKATRDAVESVRAGVDEPDVRLTLEVVAAELAAAAGEIADLVAGLAPEELGGGRLEAALKTLAARCPLPVSVEVARDAIGGPEAEKALYFVCSEALVNAVKHARATRVVITVAARRGELVATITDDGRGGVDPSGQGLLGLADRLATRNGKLRVVGLPGAGTTVTAIVRP